MNVRLRSAGCKVISAATRFRRGLISSGLLVPVGMALMFLMNVVLARKLGPAQFGSFSFVFAAATMIVLVATLGVPAAAMRFIAQYAEAMQWGLAKGVLRWSFRMIVPSAVVVAAMVAVAGWWLADSTTTRWNWLYIAILTLPMTLWVWQRFTSLGFHWIPLALVPRDLTLPAVMSVLALLPWFDTSRAMVYACAMALLVLEGIAIWRMRSRLPAEMRSAVPETRNRLWTLTALPLALTSVMQLGMNRWDLLVLGWYGDMHQTGLYNAASRLALLATPVSRVVVTFTGPMFAAAYNNGKVEELRILKRRSLYTTLACGLPLAIILLAVPGTLLAHLYGESYRPAASALRILAAGQLVALFAVPSSTLLWMGGGIRRQAVIAALGAAGCLVLCVVLIPIWGGDGAAVGAAASLAITSLLYIWAAGRIPSPSFKAASGQRGHASSATVSSNGDTVSGKPTTL